MDLVTKLFDLADGKGKPSPRERIEALKILLAYGFGLPGAHIELSGPGGGPVETREVPLETLTTGELRARLAELEGRRVEREGAEVGNQSFAERP